MGFNSAFKGLKTYGYFMYQQDEHSQILLSSVRVKFEFCKNIINSSCFPLRHKPNEFDIQRTVHCDTFL